MSNVVIYLDGTVNVTGFRELHKHCRFVLSPYDSPAQRRTDVKWELAVPSGIQWRDWNALWKDIHHSWESHKASEKLQQIYSIIGGNPSERRDGLHLDSAYKSDVHALLTSDKGDIWNHRHALEPLLGFKIFYPDSEVDLVKDFISRLVGKEEA